MTPPTETLGLPALGDNMVGKVRQPPGSMLAITPLTEGSGWFEGPGLQPVEQRLRGVTKRLERMAHVLERKLAAPAPAADVLAHEADHRIGNSLQIVSSLLQRQALAAPEDAVRMALQLASSRVTAVAELHAALEECETGPAPAVELASYIGGLCGSLRQVVEAEAGAVLHVALEPLLVRAALARSVGLVVSELVINALRHAFTPGSAGRIWVNGGYTGGLYRLCIEDDGKGLPPGFDLHGKSHSLGLRLLATMAAQMQVGVTADQRLGARFTLTIALPHPQVGAASTWPASL